MSFLSWSTDEGVDPAPVGLQPGDEIGGYRLLTYLGGGGMGVVFRAQNQTGREVALKLSHQDPQLRQRLQREGQLIAALRHPGILSVHTAGEDQGWTYIACELVEGARGFDQLLGTTEREVLLDYLAAAADALGHAHTRGVVHRDVKAANLLVDDEGRLVVADFGLGWREGSLSLTKTGAQVGTPYAMAPEQINGEAATPASDVWGLGVLLYQVLTRGALPFPGPTPSQLAEQVQAGSPTPPSQLAPDVPSALEALCLRCLSRDLSARPGDGVAFFAALHAARADRTAARSNLPRVLVGAFVAIALGLAGWFASTPPSAPAPAPAPQPGTPATALALALTAFEAGTLPRADLAGIVSSSSGHPALGAAHLALARPPARGRAAWEDRLAHARAAEGAGAPLDRALAAQALALERLDRDLAASSILRLRAERSGVPAHWVECARSLLRIGEAERALGVLRNHGLPSAEALRIQFAAQLTLGQLDAASTTARNRDLDPGGVLARLLEAISSYRMRPRRRVQALRQALRSSERSPLLRLELARAYLSQGRATAALDTLSVPFDPNAIGGRAAERKREDLRQITEALHGKIDDQLDPDLWDITAVCFLREALIQIGLIRRARELHAFSDPQRPVDEQASLARTRTFLLRSKRLGLAEEFAWAWHTALAEIQSPTDPLSGRNALAGMAAFQRLGTATVRRLGVEPMWVDRLAGQARAVPTPLKSVAWIVERIARVGVALPREATRALTSIKPLVALASGTAWIEHLHAELLILVGQSAGARAVVQRVTAVKAGKAWSDARACGAIVTLCERLGIDPGPWAARRDSLEGQSRGKSLSALTNLAGLPVKERLQALARIRRADPTFMNEPMLLAYARLQPDLIDRQRTVVAAADQDPRLLSAAVGVTRDALPSLTGVARGAYGGDRHGLLCEAIVTVARAEAGQARADELERAALDLTRALELAPGEPTTRTLRAFVFHRLGRRRSAERDLRLAAELTPNAAQLLFVRALLRAAAGAPVGEVLALLSAAWKAGYASAADPERTLGRFPEFARLRGDARVQRLGRR